MKKLAPSILAADFLELGEDIRIIDRAGAEYIHIDVMDGHFVPSISFGIPVLSALRKITTRVLDVHLMIIKPERYIQAFASAGADIITFHVEASSCVEATIEAIHKLGLKAGLSLNPSTPISEITPYLTMVDLVLIMTVNPGFGGQKYIEVCTEKIRELKAIINDKGLEVELEVDGGINKENIKMVLDAGIDVVVAGSSIFGDETQKNTDYFMEVINKENNR